MTSVGVEHILLTVSSGSVIVATTIVAPDRPIAEQIVAVLQRVAADTMPLSAALGMTLEAVSYPLITEQNVGDRDGSLIDICTTVISDTCQYASIVGRVHLPGLIAVCVVSGMLIGFSLCVLFCCWRLCCRRRKGENDDAVPPPPDPAWGAYFAELSGSLGRRNRNLDRYGMPRAVPPAGAGQIDEFV